MVPGWHQDCFHSCQYLIAYSNAKENPPAQTIDIVNSDGTEVEAVVVDGSQASDPAWSPWSNGLVYSQLAGKERHLFKITLSDFGVKTQSFRFGM